MSAVFAGANRTHPRKRAVVDRFDQIAELVVLEPRFPRWLASIVPSANCLTFVRSSSHCRVVVLGFDAVTNSNAADGDRMADRAVRQLNLSYSKSAV
jgi:hypothetical protein